MKIGRASVRARVILLLAVLVLCVAGPQAMATSGILGTWSATYPASTLDETLSCSLCHTSAPAFNPYGQDLSAAGGTAAGMAQIAPLDSDGDSFTNIVEITANSAPGDPASQPQAVVPVASFTGTPLIGIAPLVVNFTDTSTGPPTSWAWTFGDGGTATIASLSHSFDAVGTYTISLMATNALGSDTEIKPRYILVTFPDVPADYWALKFILATVDAGIVTGFPNGTYGPTIEVTRDQMAVFIARAIAGGDANVPSGPATPSFPDVPTDNFSYRYVEYAKSQNIVTGFPNGTYAPTVPVSRDQMAVFISRSVVTPHGDEGLAGFTPPTTPSFPDVPTDNFAYKYVEYAKSQNIVQGFPSGEYKPAVVVTRDQMAVFIQRAFDLPIAP